MWEDLKSGDKEFTDYMHCPCPGFSIATARGGNKGNFCVHIACCLRYLISEPAGRDAQVGVSPEDDGNWPDAWDLANQEVGHDPSEEVPSLTNVPTTPVPVPVMSPVLDQDGRHVHDRSGRPLYANDRMIGRLVSREEE